MTNLTLVHLILVNLTLVLCCVSLFLSDVTAEGNEMIMTLKPNETLLPGSPLEIVCDTTWNRNNIFLYFTPMDASLGERQIGNSRFSLRSDYQGSRYVWSTFGSMGIKVRIEQALLSDAGTYRCEDKLLRRSKRQVIHLVSAPQCSSNTASNILDTTESSQAFEVLRQLSCSVTYVGSEMPSIHVEDSFGRRLEEGNLTVSQTTNSATTLSLVYMVKMMDNVTAYSCVAVSDRNGLIVSRNAQNCTPDYTYTSTPSGHNAVYDTTTPDDSHSDKINNVASEENDFGSISGLYVAIAVGVLVGCVFIVVAVAVTLAAHKRQRKAEKGSKKESSYLKISGAYESPSFYEKLNPYAELTDNKEGITNPAIPIYAECGAKIETNNQMSCHYMEILA